jgi:hypothetical protein
VGVEEEEEEVLLNFACWCVEVSQCFGASVVRECKRCRLTLMLMLRQDRNERIEWSE